MGICTHSMSKTKTYRTWVSMKERCYYKKHQSYSRYGGIGITVCDEWLESFDNFFSDMGVKPSSMTLERLASRGGYSKDNCTWDSATKQNTNKTNAYVWFIFGKRFETSTEAAKHHKVTCTTITSWAKRGHGGSYRVRRYTELCQTATDND